MTPLRFPPFDSKNTQRFVYLEAEPKKFEDLVHSVEGETPGEIMEAVIDKMTKDINMENLDKTTKEDIKSTKKSMKDIFQNYENDLITTLNNSNSTKKILIRELLSLNPGIDKAESPFEMLFALENAAILLGAKSIMGSLSNVLVKEGKENKATQEKGRKYEIKGTKNAYNIIENAALAKMALNAKNEKVIAMIKEPQGKKVVERLNEDFKEWLWAQIEDATSGLGLGIFSTQVTITEATKIRRAVRSYKPLWEEEGFEKAMKELNITVDKEEIDKEAIKKSIEKGMWISFAKEMEKYKVWGVMTEETEKTKRDESLLKEIKGSQFSNNIINNLGLGKNPSICMVGTRVYVLGGEEWKRADIEDLKKADKSSFKSCTEKNYIDDLRKNSDLNQEALSDIEAILNNKEEIKKRIGERISITKDFGPFKRDRLMNWRLGTPPQDIQKELTNAVGSSFERMIRDYKLTFLDKDILKEAEEVKLKAINEAFKNMNMPNIIDGIDQECRDLSQAADPPQEYKPYERFQIQIFPTGIRVVPYEQKPVHASIFKGATYDAIKDKVTKEMELKNHPLAKIPLIGPLLVMFLADADPKMMKTITAISAFFGIKNAPIGKEIKNIIKKKTDQEMQKIAESYTALYPAIKTSEFEEEVLKEKGVKSRKEGVNSVMLSGDSMKLTGVIILPAGSTLRSFRQINVKMLEVKKDGIDKGITSINDKKSETRENFYASEDKNKVLLIKCEDVILKKDSNIPVGMRFLPTTLSL